MNDMLIKNGDFMTTGLNSVKPAGESQVEGKGFSHLLKDAIEDINKLQTNADEAISKVQLDNTASIHEAMIALEQANISFRAMMQVRNKILDAYQEVMRTQV
jgi:flagellar hook-basal body complex protein FliE